MGFFYFPLSVVLNITIHLMSLTQGPFHLTLLSFLLCYNEKKVRTLN